MRVPGPTPAKNLYLRENVDSRDDGKQLLACILPNLTVTIRHTPTSICDRVGSARHFQSVGRVGQFLDRREIPFEVGQQIV